MTYSLIAPRPGRPPIHGRTARRLLAPRRSGIKNPASLSDAGSAVVRSAAYGVFLPLSGLNVKLSTEFIRFLHILASSDYLHIGVYVQTAYSSALQRNYMVHMKRRLIRV